MTTPTPNFLGTHVRRGRPRGVARLRRRFEHVCDLCPYNAGVGGSNPSPPTKRKTWSMTVFDDLRYANGCSSDREIQQKSNIRAMFCARLGGTRRGNPTNLTRHESNITHPHKA